MAEGMYVEIAFALVDKFSKEFSACCAAFIGIAERGQTLVHRIVPWPMTDGTTSLVECSLDALGKHFCDFGQRILCLMRGIAPSSAAPTVGPRSTVISH